MSKVCGQDFCELCGDCLVCYAEDPCQKNDGGSHVSNPHGKILCRFGCPDPIGVYHVPQGCICWDDPIQALCPQHLLTAESEGPIRLLVDLSEGSFDIGKWRRN